MRTRQFGIIFCKQDPCSPIISKHIPMTPNTGTNQKKYFSIRWVCTQEMQHLLWVGAGQPFRFGHGNTLLPSARRDTTLRFVEQSLDQRRDRIAVVEQIPRPAVEVRQRFRWDEFSAVHWADLKVNPAKEQVKHFPKHLAASSEVGDDERGNGHEAPQEGSV